MKHKLAELGGWLLNRYADHIQKQRILTECVKKHFNTVSAEDILHENADGTISFKGEKLDGSIKKELGVQARVLEDMFVWKVIREDVLYTVNRRMYDGAAEIQDMISAKVAVWLFKEVIERRLKKLKSN